MSEAAGYRADPRHVELGPDFFDVVEPAAFPERLLRFRNQRWADRVGLRSLSDDAWLDHFASFQPLPDNLERPLALRYHGHQFQSYNPDLGDGRGFLFAQLRDTRDSRLLDLGTKGSGQTPWSRGGDGRLTLKGGIREVLATAMLEALGVYTSKTFSLVETGEALTRGDEPSPTRSSVLVRLSHSHIRFGSFQRQAYLQQPDNLRRLVDYSVASYIPDLLALEGDARTAAFLLRVVEASARLAAGWMAAGFVHGVLNTDNLNITGESFDYGPYRFLPTLDPGFTAAYFDQTGLYAYGQQPRIVAWNLSRLAETLLPICEKEPLVESLQSYEPIFHATYCEKMLARLGIRPRSGNGANDVAFVNEITKFLHESQIPFERLFFDWWGGESSRERAARSPVAEYYRTDAFAPLMSHFERYEASNPHRLASDYFAGDGPCTLLVDEIESLWSRIAEDDDWSAFDAKLEQIEGMREVLTER